MKLQLILNIYDTLVCGNYVVRKDFCAQHDITERTFYRYMNEITSFLRNYKKNCVVDVVESSGKYFLKSYGD